MLVKADSKASVEIFIVGMGLDKKTDVFRLKVRLLYLLVLVTWRLDIFGD